MREWERAVVIAVISRRSGCAISHGGNVWGRGKERGNSSAHTALGGISAMLETDG